MSEALRDYSGYVRQAAVERCAALGSSQCLSMAASRLNDWVPQVRSAARQAVLHLLAGASREEQLLALGMVVDLRRTGRTNHEQWIAEFEQAFLSQVGAQALWGGLARGARMQSRACYELLRKQPNVEIGRLLAHCVASRDDIVLALRGAEAAYQLPTEQAAPVLLIALASHFGAVRRVALQGLLKDEGRSQLASQFLLDKHASVRGLSISYLRERRFDLASFYRNVAVNPGARHDAASIALVSLAGMGCNDDLALIKTFTRSAAVRVRKAAYAAWLKLAPGEKDALALQAFSDDSISVRKFARDVMDRHGAYVAFSDLYRIVGQSDVALELVFITRSHKWNWLEAIATMARDLPPGSPLAAGLAMELRRWTGSARWSRNRLLGKQAVELSSPATLAALEALVAGELDQIAELTEQISSAATAGRASP